MPVEQKWHFTCPITRQVVMSEGKDLPARWARIAEEVYSPDGMGILAHRILAHPDAPYEQLLTSEYPSAAYDDWQNV